MSDSHAERLPNPGHAPPEPDVPAGVTSSMSAAAAEKLNMHWTSHMDQYDVLSHPQSQSLLPYLISSQPREDTIMRNRLIRRTAASSDLRTRGASPLWPPASVPGSSGMSTGVMYKDPGWRNQQISFLHSTQKPHMCGLGGAQRDPYGTVTMPPDEHGNPRHFRWYQRERLAPDTPLRSTPHPYSSERYSRRVFDYAHRAQLAPLPLSAQSAAHTAASPSPPAGAALHARSQSISHPVPSPSAQPVMSSTPMRPRVGASQPLRHGSIMLEPYLSTSATPPPDVQRHDSRDFYPINPQHVCRFIPPAMQHYFGAEDTSLQPHLDKLRERKHKLQMALSTGDWSLSEDAALIMQDTKRRKTNTVNQGPLSAEEKKANHIASEQKRRANIRKGYEQLAGMLPGLEKELSTQAQSDDGADARTSVPSEISILMEAVKYVQLRLQKHERLRQRRNELQHQLLAQYMHS